MHGESFYALTMATSLEKVSAYTLCRCSKKRPARLILNTFFFCICICFIFIYTEEKKLLENKLRLLKINLNFIEQVNKKLTYS